MNILSIYSLEFHETYNDRGKGLNDGRNDSST